MLKHFIHSHSKSIHRVTALVATTATLAALRMQITDPVSKSIFVKHGDTFEVSLLPVTSYEPDYIVPGESTVSFDPFITNKGDYDVYVFIEITLPDEDFSLDKVGSDWTPVYSDGLKKVFVYGSSSAAEPLKKRHKSNGEFLYDSSTELNTVISLSEDSDLEGGPYNIEAIGYAVEANTAQNSPDDLWNHVEEQLSIPE